MDLMYTSTRNKNVQIPASMAVIKGISEDGGLFVPTAFNKLDKSLEELSKMDYKGVAYEVMKLFLTDYSEEELKGCIERAYDSKFDTEEIAPMAEVDKAYYLELFHGSTIAFKDMALSILPHLMTVAAKKNNVDKEIVILTATSGDTGKAALAGFADVPGTRIVVFYPKNGVSAVQEKQMVTQKGANVKVIGITGNFDDAQSGVKEIFTDKKFGEKIAEKGFVFSSANSINIGRLIPQVAYYVFAYTRLIKEERIKAGDKINFTVPTGNFGNILAGYYAKRIGLPVNKLICASNDNKVLFDFFKTGIYDKNREFILTSSPSMDILISSNLERLIYFSAGEDSAKNAELMKNLSTAGKYEISEDMKKELADFVGGYATQDEVSETIGSIYDKTGYVLDTHTAVAANVYYKYVKENKDETPTVIVSTASPFKFTRSVVEAIEKTKSDKPDFELIDHLSEISGIEVPKAVEEIRTAPVLHDTVLDREKMREGIASFLGF